MMQAFLMVLREGFESFLIVAIILSYLDRTGKRRLFPIVFSAIAASVAASIGLGLLLSRGVNQALWEAILGVVTLIMVGTLVIHMWRSAPHLKTRMVMRLEKATANPGVFWPAVGIFLFTLVMIAREGMETALMLLQVRDGGVLGGILLGLAGAGGVSWMWWKSSHLVNLRRFFQITGAFLMLFMIQVAIYSFHEFSEAGLLPYSEKFHVATEPYSPYGIYGQWFSAVMVSVCVGWLIVAFVADRIRGNPNAAIPTR